MPRIFPTSAAKPISATYTSSQTISIPAGVTSVNLVGHGAPGSPATSGSFGPPVSQSEYVTSVVGLDTNGGSSTIPGSWRWENSQSNGPTARDRLNAGGNYDFVQRDFTQYADGWSSASRTITTGVPIPGSAYLYTSGGWQTSGPITPGTFEFMYLAWQEYGDFIPGTPATTGASASAFGKTFPGGTGGAAADVSYSGVAVTPGPATLTIPSGGSITISYVVN